MAGDCINDGCGIILTSSGAGLRADLDLSANPCNALTCGPNGLYAVKDECAIVGGVIPAFSVDLFNYAVGVPTQVSISPNVTIVNESACNIGNLLSMFAANEVEYNTLNAGATGGFYSISYEVSTDGGATWNLVCGITCDYRVQATAGGFSDSRFGGSAAGGLTIAPGASKQFQYRVMLTNLDTLGLPAGVFFVSSGTTGLFFTSPAATFSHMMISN
jgi:hypothetical protein